MSLVFPAKEFRNRAQRLQTAMQHAEIDALLLTSPADIFYITGFLTRFWESPARPWFVLVPVAQPPVAIIPSIGAPLMARTWITEIRTWDAPHPGDDGVSLLADTLHEHVPPNGCIGVPMGLETHLRMPLADYARVTEAMGQRRFVDGTGVIQRTREIKSAAEIARIRAVCDIAGRAFDDMAEIAQPGVGLDAVFRAFQSRLLQHGADWVSYVAGAAGADGYADVISPATTDPLQAGEVLMLDTGAVKEGYFCDYDRNFFIGTPSDAMRRTDDALWGATEDALETLRPGMLACDAHRILADGVTRRNARPCGGRLGHGLGITLTEWPSFTPLDTTALREGMVLTLEPSAYVSGDRFLTHEENIVLRADGPELLSPRARRHRQGQVT